jgi:ribonuclease HII
MVFGGVLYKEALFEIDGLTDSKLLKEPDRNTIFKKIVGGDFKFGIGIAWPDEIDKNGLSFCSRLCIERVCESIDVKPDYFLMDGNLKVPDKFLFVENESIVKGDQKHVCIAAASIIAKVFRDGMMKLYAEHSPFSYDRHKAYLTKLHKNEIKEYGLERIHRKSYNISIV